jgi:hypothetical protein
LILMIIRVLSSLAMLAIPATLFAQATLDGFYQVNYASHLSQGDGVVNVTNSGTSAGANIPIANINTYGDICVNAYVYAPDQELAACCTCLVSPNSLHSWPIAFGPGNLLSLVNNTTVLNSIFTAGTGNGSVVIKLLSTAPTGGGAGLGASCPRPDQINFIAVFGLVAWATHSHPTNIANTVSITETPFVNSSLSTGELGKLTADCQSLLGRQSGTVCPNCQTGGLAAPSL